jgi:hypothetical protein
VSIRKIGQQRHDAGDRHHRASEAQKAELIHHRAFPTLIDGSSRQTLPTWFSASSD